MPRGAAKIGEMASTYTSLNYHLVFASKDRAPLITPDRIENLHAYLGGTVKGLGGSPIAIGGIEDHVHLLVGLKATHCVADLVRDLKKTSSAWEYEHAFRDFAWQVGYGAFTVGVNALPNLTTYIRNHRSVIWGSIRSRNCSICAASRISR